MSETFLCSQCGAQLPIPTDLAVLKVRCSFCGADRNVPDFDRRVEAHARLERERAATERERARLEAEMRERAEDRVERKQEKARDRVRWAVHTVWISGVVLIGPTIVLSQVYDLPTRFWGPSGADRVAVIETQLRAAKCSRLVPPRTLYSDGETVDQIVNVPAGACIEVLAAGGRGQDQITARLFDPAGRPIGGGGRPSGRDARIHACVPVAGMYRYAIDPGRFTKGRLTHLALACPPEGPAMTSEVAPGTGAVEPPSRPDHPPPAPPHSRRPKPRGRSSAPK